MPPSLRYPGRPIRIRFLSRPNRFLAWVVRPSGGRRFAVHVPNPGRMEELLIPRVTEGWVRSASAPKRRTRYDLVAVRAGRTTVSVDSQAANRLVGASLRNGGFRSFGPGPWRSELRWHGSRWDFGVVRPGSSQPVAVLEVKSSNLRVGTTALFPDAPTERGTRHLLHLAEAQQLGIRAGLLVVIQRLDVERFRPNAALDPKFARAFEEARNRGVRVEAWTLRVRPGSLEWGAPVPVLSVGRKEPYL